MVARLRDNERQSWRIGKLTGCDRYPQFPEERWFIEKSCGTICQVYDAPDHGEGYELIDTRKARKQEGDEVLGDDGKWSLADPYNFVPELHYRRRITPTVSYVPFTWEDREQLRGRWVRCVDVADNEWMITSMYIGGSGELRANGTHADRLLSGFVFIETGKPVGKEVTQ